MRPTLSLALATVLLAVGGTLAAAPSVAAPDVARPTWQVLPTGSFDTFRGLSVVDDQVAWVSSDSGTVLRTGDGGRTWQSVGPALSPRRSHLAVDVEATSADAAVVLVAGYGDQWRIFRTQDGGATWAVTFVNHDPAGFYDCLAFNGADHGYALSDPVDGAFRLVETRDGGSTWTGTRRAKMPPALPGEAALVGSSCLSTGKGDNVYFGTYRGGRVFSSINGGRTWQVATALSGGARAGVRSVKFRDARYGVAVGDGDAAAAWSNDGGATWTPAPTASGVLTSVEWAPGLPYVALAVGSRGSMISRDGGKSWRTFDRASVYDAVQCTVNEVCWASGGRDWSPARRSRSDSLTHGWRVSWHGSRFASMSRRVIPVLAAVVLAAAAVASAAPVATAASHLTAPAWSLLSTGSTERFRGLAAVGDRVAWASGTGGTVLRTVDGGRSWRSVGPPDTADLQFRDIEAFDAEPPWRCRSARASGPACT